ncbi:MAG TPA: hypothetical protein VFG84_07835 [Gemmatimonadaceae bacterium]|nr:hypothetical protein [Gemmatimonadaceae bacterium]
MRPSPGILIIAACIVAACGPPSHGAAERTDSANAARDTMQSPTRPIADVQRDHERELLAIPGVVGIGIGECGGSPCLRVMADGLTRENRARIPSRIEGYRVEVDDTGEIRARDTTPG